MIGTEISQYRLIEKLGEGGMGVVYKAMDVMLDRVVAVKLVSAELADNQELLERFKSEAKVQATLSHPNVATLYSYLVWEGRAVMVMEFIEGETLQQMIARRGPVPSELAVPLFKQALLGVGAAHRRGIVHRDIKPANIMVNGDGHIKVMDFGIAKVLGVDGRTRTNLRMGTAWYMAPEQVLNRKVDARTDIYALGVTLYEILSGQVPFRADSEYEILSAHVQKQPELPTEHYPHIPQSCVSAVMRALEKEPENRFASTDEFIAALDQNASGSTATIAPAAQPVEPIHPSAPAVPSVVFSTPEKVSTPPLVGSVVAPPPSEKKRSPWLGVTAAAVLVVILGAAALIMFMREREKHAVSGGGGHQASTSSQQHASVTGEQERRMQAEQDQAAEELKDQLAKEQAHPAANSGGQQQAAMTHPATPTSKPQNQPPRNPPNSTVAQAPLKNQDEATRLQKLSGTWSGTYSCQHGVTGVTLQIVANSSQNVGALLQFAVPNSRSGAYFMRGVFNPATNGLAMNFTSWKYQPEGYAAANITGTVNFASNELRGTILLPGCAGLSMRKQ